MMVSIPTLTRSFLVAAIKSSAAQKNLPLGKSVHAHVIKSGYLPETLLSNHLLNMYAKSSCFSDAHNVFDEIPDKNLVSFSTLISASSRSGDPMLALSLVNQLHKLSLNPNQFVFSSSIVACTKLNAVSLGHQVHAQVVVLDFESDPFVKTSLIDMYSKFGDLDSALSVFGRGPAGDPVMFNSMISGLTGFGYYEEALEILGKARRDLGFKPTEYSFGSIIKACGNLGKEVGEQFHGFIVKTGFDSNFFVGTSLVDMYGRFGNMEGMEMVCEIVSSWDLALYNAIIVGLSQNGLDEIALQYFNELRLEGFIPNECSFSSALKACGGLKDLDSGKCIHGVVEKSIFQQDLVVNTALIDMYMKCGRTDDSYRLFNHMPERNTISYNSMISGLGQNGKFGSAVCIYIDMIRQEIETDLGTFVALMSSCLGHEWSAFVQAIKHGFGLDLMVENALLDGLFKRNAAGEALEFFNKMNGKNVVSWTTVISGLTHLGFYSDAIGLFKEMKSLSVSPNKFTFSSSLKACGSVAGLEQGRCIHGCAIKHGCVGDEFTNCSLLDMYAKCGALEESYMLFDELPTRDVVAWNTMIAGYAQHGYAQEALRVYSRMEDNRVEPNQVTFVSLLSACSHCGLVDDGVRIFELMVSKHGVVLSSEHYACMVDLFGRAGMLDRAKNLIYGMPFEADASIWTAFLVACKLNGNVELARLARERVASMGGEDNPTLVLMSNIYSEVGKWDDAANARKRVGIGERGKEPGVSWVQIQEESLLLESSRA